MPSPLDSLCGPTGSLQREPPDAKEFTGLVRSGEVRLADAKRVSNSIEGRFDLAYNAAHSLSLAALRHAGYRASKRYIVFQSLEHTLGLGPDVWRVLDRAHNDRNRSEYEGGFSVEKTFPEAVIEAADRVLEAVKRLPEL